MLRAFVSSLQVGPWAPIPQPLMAAEAISITHLVLGSRKQKTLFKMGG